jgi:Predicted transcriptional regulator
MNGKTIDLTEAEWQVMECLWEKAPKTGRQLVNELAGKTGWGRSTTLTFLRRLEAKKAVASEEGEVVLEYRPLIAREEAALAETESFIGRVYNGSLSLLVSSMTKRQKLSKEEIGELYALLREMEEKE